jgi:hypothetical protein
MRILATIHPPDATQAILTSLGLPVRAPPLAPARRDEERCSEWPDAGPDDFGS